jgi:hypothetical protein
MWRASSDPAKVLEEVKAKGKGVVSLEVMEEASKPALIADGAESSRQGAARKEGSGKSPNCFRC